MPTLMLMTGYHISDMLCTEDQVDPEAAAHCEPPLRSILKDSLACDVRNEPVVLCKCV